MENYKLSVQAEEDLYRIYRWGVLTYGEIKADDYFSQLIRRFEMIAAEPLCYPAVDHICEGYRRSVFGRDSIYYRIINNTVEIMAIIGQQNFQITLTMLETST